MAVRHRSAEEIVWDALRGALVTRALGLAADLGVAQALSVGPRSSAQLAHERDVDPDLLQRVLRALASDGIFEESEPGVFRNTAASELLARDGWDDFAHLFAGVWLQAVAALDASGEPSFPRVHGDGFWAWLREHPGERAAFDRAMAQGWQSRLERLETVDWRGDELVVDVGGGNGSLLLALLERHPRMRGVVFDLPETVRDQQAFCDRCTFEEGSFFESVPPGDVHLLSTILHDWDDLAAQQILETIRAAAGARLVVLDSVIEPGNAADGAKVARPADACNRRRQGAHRAAVARVGSALRCRLRIRARVPDATAGSGVGTRASPRWHGAISTRRGLARSSNRCSQRRGRTGSSVTPSSGSTRTVGRGRCSIT